MDLSIIGVWSKAMNTRCLIKITAVFFAGLSTAALALDCSKPCGPDEVLSCVGQKNKPSLTAEQVYDQKVFNKNNADQFCASKCSPVKIPDPSHPGQYIVSQLQADYCKMFCPTEAGTYYSYKNFIDAYVAMQTQDASFAIACSETLEESERELANLFATAAQETTQGISRTNDGGFYRYEDGWLNKTPAGTPCDNFDCQTNYYGTANNAIVAVHNDTNEVLTKYYFDNGTIDSVTNHVAGSKVTLTGAGPTLWTWEPDAVPPANFTFKRLTDAGVQPGYWVGMGPIQLTGGPVMEFFGWYENHLAVPNLEKAKLQDFIQSLVKDGKLGFQGLFYYWNYRTGGAGRHTIHDTLNSSGLVCHDIAIVTRLVNGGCNNYQTRKSYYNYFAKSVMGFQDNSTCVDQAYNRVSCTETSKVYIDSLECNYTGEEELNPNRLQIYCDKQF